MADRLLELAAPRDGERWVDATVGAGGHSLALLEAARLERLFAIDRDPDALAAAGGRLAAHADRVVRIHGRLGELDRHLAEAAAGPVDGIIADLGVSSMQLDRAERGFSLRRPGPIDMRMDPTSGETALDLLRRLPLDELARILREHGEERYARRVAAAIREAARAGELTTTTDLAAAVEAAIPAKARRHLRIHPATRTFQALRIAVNGELDELDALLAMFPRLLAPGGRCAIISFHSLEDRRVKRRFRELAWSSSLPPQLAAAAGERVVPIVEILTRRPAIASDEEIAANPRARSARLRVCRKIGEASA
jgi:16S rRNA (cytosine1402-N4)-methyltransferase